jgi:predicted transcriptional regulator
VDDTGVINAPEGDDTGYMLVLAAGTTLVAVGGAGVYARNSQNRGFRWLTLLFGFVGMSRRDPLENDRRAMIYRLIEAEPGITLSELKRQLDIMNGSMAYHIGRLERFNKVASAPHPLDARARCYWIPGTNGDEPPVRLTPTQQAMVDHLRKYPGATVSELSRNMEPRRTQQTLDHTAKRLLEAGYLRREPGPGGSFKLFVVEDE